MDCAGTDGLGKSYVLSEKRGQEWGGIQIFTSLGMVDGARSWHVAAEEEGCAINAMAMRM